MTRISPPDHRLLACLACAALGCAPVHGGTGDSGADAGPDAASDAGVDDLDSFFGIDTIHTIAIDVDEAGVASLLETPRTYVQASIDIDGTSYQGVGVRLKGQAGSFVALDGDYPEISGDGNGRPGKSAFIVDFNRFAPGQKHLGLAKLTINNMVQDDSGIHEYLGYTLFREGEVPAPRTGFATVTFNGEIRGLYALIETPDNAEFLERWYGTKQGNLYEGAYGVDLEGERWQEFDQDAGDDRTLADIAELVSALDGVGEDGDPTTVLEQYFDLDEYAAFAVTELYLGHWDGYASSANNYMIHRNPDDGKWTFLPWGIDQVFEDPMGEFAGVMRAPGPSWSGHGGRIHRLCFASTSCRSRLATAYRNLLQRIDDLAFADMAADARATIEPLMLAESTEYGDPGLTADALDQVGAFIGRRGEEIQHWLPCLEGGSVDSDGDTYDDCTEDCNAHAADVHPGAAETCNFADDDCNGVLDDPDNCPRCLDTLAPDGNNYSLCVEPKSWADAHAYCSSREQELASIHDNATFEHLAFTLIDRLGTEAAWIGLGDGEVEGTYVWTDGTPLDFLRWAGETPEGAPDLDCVASYPFGWLIEECGRPLPFICK